ncbi:hypothetical protein HHI36_010948 [Cryptolaemus montrouzieri]|uniref:BTB domain-containing protein n=1 Tax=Cryptolaemus montrouzieri TaxID=559131 RepID=A0ABD2MKD0_9CUCU
MVRLENLCIQYLNATICLKNVLVALHNADQLQLKFIKEHCLRFIVKESNYNQIVMSAEFEDLERGLMVEIIRRKQMPQNKVSSNDQHHPNANGSSLEQDMAMFLIATGKEFCDIDLILDSHVIPAHKSILAARCGYFEAMFRSFMPSDNTVRIQIGEMIPSKESFDSLLGIYTMEM